MSKFSLVRASMEELELEIDKAIEKQEIQEGDDADALLSIIKEPTEEPKDDGDAVAPTEDELPVDQTEETSEEAPAALPESEDQKDAREASVAAESFFRMIDRGIQACASLEQIADIIESSQDVGGISQSTASITKTVVECICNDLDLPEQRSSVISVESFSSSSSRLRLSMEAMEDIKKKIEYIWGLIISGFTSILQFIRKAVIAYKSDMGKQKEELEKLREIYRNIKNVDPAESELTGVLHQILLNNNSASAKSSEVIALGKSTLSILDSYIVSFRRNLSTSIEAIDSIGLEIITPDTEFKKDDVVKFGKIFGVHQSPVLNKKPSINDFKKTTDTVSCFETDLFAGNMKLVSFTATEGNLALQDILESKCLLVTVERVFEGVKMEVCEESDFRKLFELIDEAIRISIKSYEVADSVDKSIAGILKTTQSLSSKLVQGLSQNKEITETSKRNSLIYSQLTAALQAFYTKPIAAVLRFNNRYVKALNAYGLASLKQYM